MPQEIDLKGRVCLVTGGAGMLGRAIVYQLLGKGADVRILDIEPAQNSRAEMIAGDVRDATAVRKACVGVDTVFHAAAAAGLDLRQRGGLLSAPVLHGLLAVASRG